MLAVVMRLLKRTAMRRHLNKMSPTYLASVWVPDLIRLDDLEREHRLLKTSIPFVEQLINLCDELFAAYYKDLDA